MNVWQETAVIIPTYGEHPYTQAVVRQITAEAEWTVYVIDSAGDFEATGSEVVIRPDTRLRWATACNEGLRVAADRGHSAFCLLNNDVVLSPGFTQGLVDAWTSTRAGIVAPTYDHSWRHQWPTTDFPRIAARDYKPERIEREIPFADGTCLFIPSSTLNVVGHLDDITWPLFNWGCDQDLALRAREAGLRIVTTHRSFLNHIGRRTARRDSEYSENAALRENVSGMTSKWGPDWLERLFAGYPGIERAGLQQSEVEFLAQENYVR
jgi:GT2 family glycosyltransferase